MNHVVAVLQLMFICICAISALNRSDSSIEDRIINGHVAQQGQFPYIIFIISNVGCDGSILSSHWVVSAGHCFYHYQDQPERFIVVAGLVDLNNISHPEVQKVQVASVHVHPRYEYVDDLPINDIAMVRLSSDLKFTDTVKPIALPQTHEILYKMATTSGWGATTVGLSMGSNILRYFMAPVYSSHECKFQNKIRDPENFICTMDRHHNASGCHGDSGGPLVQNEVLIGIVSFGDPECNSSTSFYTRVASYKHFINEYLKD